MKEEIEDVLATSDGRAALRQKVQAELVVCSLKLSAMQEDHQKCLTLLALLDSLDADYTARRAATTIH